MKENMHVINFTSKFQVWKLNGFNKGSIGVMISVNKTPGAEGQKYHYVPKNVNIN